MSLAKLSAAFSDVARSASAATEAIQTVSQSLEEVAAAAEAPQQGFEEILAKMEELSMFGETWAGTFTKPLLEAFKQGSISANEFREELNKLMLKLMELRAAGSLEKQGFGNLEGEKQEVERLLRELEKLRGRP